MQHGLHPRPSVPGTELSCLGLPCLPSLCALARVPCQRATPLPTHRRPTGEELISNKHRQTPPPKISQAVISRNSGKAVSRQAAALGGCWMEWHFPPRLSRGSLEMIKGFFFLFLVSFSIQEPALFLIRLFQGLFLCTPSETCLCSSLASRCCSSPGAELGRASAQGPVVQPAVAPGEQGHDEPYRQPAACFASWQVRAPASNGQGCRHCAQPVTTVPWQR